MMRYRQHIRALSSSRSHLKGFQPQKDYPLKCGLEIHSQLDTKYKLFSLSETSFQADPNTRVSYFDVSLPGTQPKLNPEALLFALKAAVALNSKVNLSSTFDRKHYFYGDQPLGYQITQHYSPYAKGGHVKLHPHDGIKIPQKIINIEQIQLEQDTGKSVYTEFENDAFSKIDLNRANTPLIELVTKPDFTNTDEVKAFIKKFQNLLRHLKICTGDLETGAMRVDVNISVNDGERVELKNLSTTSAVIHAIKYEYGRQVELLKSGNTTVQETRGWDGTKTVRLRVKEAALDYRYMPDPELPPINLENFITEVKDSLPPLPDEIMETLMASPYNLKLKDAQILTNDLVLLEYYQQLFEISARSNGVDPKLVINWVIHELLGACTSLSISFNPGIVPVSKLAELLILIHTSQITQPTAKLLLAHLLSNPAQISTPLSELIEDYGLAKPDESDLIAQQIDDICEEIISQNLKIVEQLKSGKKPKSIKFLVGQAMRASQGRISAQLFEARFKALVGIM